MRWNIGDEDTKRFSESDRDVITEAPRSASYRFPPLKQAEVFRTPVECHSYRAKLHDGQTVAEMCLFYDFQDGQICTHAWDHPQRVVSGLQRAYRWAKIWLESAMQPMLLVTLPIPSKYCSTIKTTNYTLWDVVPSMRTNLRRRSRGVGRCWRLGLWTLCSSMWVWGDVRHWKFLKRGTFMEKHSNNSIH